MDITNKELITKLTAYFLSSDDPELVARILANVQVDFHRIANIEKLPEEERKCLMARIKHNAEELERFARGEITSNLTYENVRKAENVKERDSRRRKKEEEFD